MLRLARAMLTGCLWPLLKGVLYGFGIIGILIYLSIKFASR